MTLIPGLGIRFFERFARFCERKSDSQIAHGRSFVKNDRSESLKSLFKKERMTKERREQIAFGHKKGKTVKNMHKIRIVQTLRKYDTVDKLLPQVISSPSPTAS